MAPIVDLSGRVLRVGLFELAPGEGLEPSAVGLTGRCSAN
jgi:hypothetical protein